MVREIDSWREPLSFRKRDDMDTIWESIQEAVLKLYSDGEVIRNEKWQSVTVENSMYEVRNLFIS